MPERCKGEEEPAHAPLCRRPASSLRKPWSTVGFFLSHRLPTLLGTPIRIAALGLQYDMRAGLLTSIAAAACLAMSILPSAEAFDNKIYLFVSL